MKKLIILLSILFPLLGKAQYPDFHQFGYQNTNGITYSFYQDSIGNAYDIEYWVFNRKYIIKVDTFDAGAITKLYLGGPSSSIVHADGHFAPGIHTDTCSTVSGISTFYLTDNGTNTGNALYPNGNIWPQFIINDSAKVYNYYWELSNSNRTLTVTVKYLDHDLLGMYLISAGTGRRVRMTITGD